MSLSQFLFSLQYTSKYIRKIIQVSVHKVSIPCKGTLYVTFLKIVPQNALDCISAHVNFKKNVWGGEGGMHPDSSRKLVTFGHTELLAQAKNPR